MALANGAVWSNVFWYVGSSATIYSGTTFNGIILAVTSITLNASATQVTAQLLANTGRGYNKLHCIAGATRSVYSNGKSLECATSLDHSDRNSQLWI